MKNKTVGHEMRTMRQHLEQEYLKYEHEYFIEEPWRLTGWKDGRDKLMKFYHEFEKQLWEMVKSEEDKNHFDTVNEMLEWTGEDEENAAEIQLALIYAQRTCKEIVKERDGKVYKEFFTDQYGDKHYRWYTVDGKVHEDSLDCE
jgi:hypothetical protein